MLPNQNLLRTTPCPPTHGLQMETCEGMGEDETRVYVADLVTQQLNVPGFELLPDQISLVSARDALRARMALCAGASAADLAAFRSVAFGRLWQKMDDPDVIK